MTWDKDAAPEPDGRQLTSVHKPVRETGRDSEQAGRFVDRERQLLVRAIAHQGLLMPAALIRAPRQVCTRRSDQQKHPR
jgi:hypothetical protein